MDKKKHYCDVKKSGLENGIVSKVVPIEILVLFIRTLLGQINPGLALTTTPEQPHSMKKLNRNHLNIEVDGRQIWHNFHFSRLKLFQFINELSHTSERDPHSA